MLVVAVVGLLVAAPAPAKTLTRAVLVGSDGAWVRVVGSPAEFANLARDHAGQPLRPRGAYVRLYYVGPGDFPANRARYYPAQRCIALDWPAYETRCVALSPTLRERFRPAHRFARFTQRPTVLSRLRYVSARGSTAALAGVTGSIELALHRRGAEAPEPTGCYPLAGSWNGSAAASRPARLLLCRNGVHAAGRLHPLSRVVWEWFRRIFGPPERAPEPPIAEPPSTCTADEVERLVERFAHAFNSRDLAALDGIFAREPDFEWYSTVAPGERLLPEAADRASLVSYFAKRHALGERLTLERFRFNGNTAGSRRYGNFEYWLTRAATDLVPSAYHGKGAALCYRERADLIFVWAMGEA